MKKRDVDVIRDAAAHAFAAQVRRELDLARTKGWKFPDGCDVAVKVIEAFEKNINKLKLRYPDNAFTLEAATKRDLAAERKVLEE